MSKYVMLIQAENCLNCGACVLACQQRNAVPYTISRNWIRQADTPDGLKFQPGACMHCDNPECVHACPTGATYKADDNRVLVDEARCIACGACVSACPYNARFIHPLRGVVDKCNYCAEGLSQQVEPACVSVCATRVRVFGDAEDPASPVSALLKTPGLHLTSVEPQTGGAALQPTLRYVGEVYDPHWPQTAHNAPAAAMGTIATGLRWLGGLSLFGVVAMLIKGLIVPADTEPTQPTDSDQPANPADSASSPSTPKSDQKDSL